jgi:hypothetical protein
MAPPVSARPEKLSPQDSFCGALLTRVRPENGNSW